MKKGQPVWVMGMRPIAVALPRRLCRGDARSCRDALGSASCARGDRGAGGRRPLDRAAAGIPEGVEWIRRRVEDSMDPEKIKVRVTETGQTLDVVVYSKRADRIEVVLGEGIHNVKCELTPTRMGLSYAGSVRGRELVYERSREQVQADIDKLNPALREPRRR